MESTEIDPGLLPTFLAVLKHGRISAAAKALYLSQPAVTARVRRLEQSVGAALFVRSAKGVAPTPAGQRLGTYARQVQGLLAEAAEQVGGSADTVGPLSLIASTTIAAHVLPQALARFRSRYPESRIQLDIGNTEQVVEDVRSGAHPLGLVEGFARAPGIRLEPWVDDVLVPVCGRDSNLRLREPADLAQTALLWREPGSGTRAVVARALRKVGVRSAPRAGDMVLSTSEAIAGAAEAGLGVAFLSRWFLGPYLAAGLLRPIPGLGFTVQRAFHWALPTGGLPGAAAQFLELARRHPPRPR